MSTNYLRLHVVPDESHVGSRSYMPNLPSGGPVPGEGIMHPMFVKLFIETDADDLLAYEEEEEKRRQSRRARRSQSRMTTMTTVRRAACTAARAHGERG